MQFVATLRELWRLRILVLMAGVLAILGGLSIGYRIEPPAGLKTRQYYVGIGSASAMLDTPNSQVVDLGGEGSGDPGGLTSRATLLASLIISAPLKDEIERG